MRHSLLLLSVIMFLSGSLMAQKDTVEVQGYYESGFTYGTLNAAIDDVKANGDINNTVFKLKPYEVYVLSSSIFMDEGENLEIVAPKPLRAGDADATTVQNSAPPQIVWTEEEIDRAYIIQTYGDLTMKNIWVRYADILGAQVSTGIVFEDALVGEGEVADKEYGTFEGMLFDYFPIGPEAGGAVTIKADNWVGVFRDTYFRNGTDVHFQYYGRAVSFPFQSTDFHIDSLVFENTTFSNLSRIVMMEGNEFVSHLYMNHVTLINSIEWAIQTGWWEDLSISNSIFVNTNMMGYRPIDVCPGEDPEFDDFEDGLCNPPGGGLVQNVVMVDSLGFEVDFEDEDRQVFMGNNVYYHEDYLLDWYTNSPWSQDQIRNRDDILLRFPPPAIGEGAMEYYDSTDAEGKKYFPNLNVMEFMDEPAGFTVPPTNQDTMLDFVMFKWNDNSDIDWSYQPNAGFLQKWPLPEDLSYSNSTYLEAAWGGYPLGDLNWYPDELADWKANQQANDWQTINNWMTTGNAEGIINSNESSPDTPRGFRLDQNYPNPFNPTTNISYTVPATGKISLKVFNSLGQQVAVLFDGIQSAGTHELTFDAATLSSGIYYYRLEAESGVSLTRKLTLIK